MLDISMIWRDSLARLSSKVTSVFYSMWIEVLKPLCLKENALVLLCPNQNTKDSINSTYKAVIEQCVTESSPLITEVILVTDAEKDTYEVILEPPATDAEPRLSPFIARYTFDTFVEGESNRLAFHAAKTVAQRPGDNEGYLIPNPLFIYGGVGLGKTHLLHSIGNYVFENSPSLNIVCVSAEQMMTEFVAALSAPSNAKNNMRSFREKYRNVDVLMIDDVQFLQRSHGLQDVLFSIFNDLYQAGKQIILTSDRPPKEIATLEERLRSRFEWGLLADIGTPNLELRSAIIRKKLALQKMPLPDDIITFIAEKYDSNVREIESALTKVILYAQLTNTPRPDLEMAKAALKINEPSKNEVIDSSDIINAVCTYFRIKESDLLSKKRTRDLADARMLAVYLVNDLLALPLVVIGQIFRRDHSTIIHSRDRILGSLDGNKELQRQIRDIRDLLFKA